MSLESFRELLIKKTQDPTLQNLITYLRDDVLEDKVLESLEKMARAKHKGDSANFPIRHFANEMDSETEPAMIHDALGHHASRYKAAMKTGRKDLANQHAKQIFRIMDLADQAQKHTQGKMHVEGPSPHAWERNQHPDTFGDRIKRLDRSEGLHERRKKGEKLSPEEDEHLARHPYTEQNKKWHKDNPYTKGNRASHHFITDTKGWRYRGSNFDFLEKDPHESYKRETENTGHTSKFPLDQIRINGKRINIDDISPEELKGYESHPFDHHPILNHFETPAGKRAEGDDVTYAREHDEYASSPHMDKFFDLQDKRSQMAPAQEAQVVNAPSQSTTVPPNTVRTVIRRSGGGDE